MKARRGSLGFFSAIVIVAIASVALPSSSALQVDHDSTKPLAFGVFPSIVMDGERPVIAYWRHNKSKLTLARCIDASCSDFTSRTIASGYVPSNSLVLDSAGNPVISYYEALPDPGLKLVRCADPECASTVTTRIEDADAGSSSIILDEDGFPVISHYTNGALQLTRCADANCASQSTVPLRTSAFSADMQFDGSGQVVIAFVSTENGLELGRCNDAACADFVSQQIDSEGQSPSLRIGADNEAVISYFSGRDRTLHIARCVAITCSRTASLADGVLDATLVVSSTDLPSVAFFEPGEGELRVMHCSDPACSESSVRTIDAFGRVGRGATIALDTNDRAAIAYVQDLPSTELRLARCATPFCADIGTRDDPPEEGWYQLQSVETGRFLDADASGGLGTSAIPKSDDEWELTTLGRSVTSYNASKIQITYSRLRNAAFSVSLEDDTVILEPANDGTFYLRDSDRKSKRFLSTNDGGTVEYTNRIASDQWRFVPTRPLPADPLVGSRIALQSSGGRWLTVEDGNRVGQSADRGVDEVWLVEDGGAGKVNLRNESNGRYLDSDRGRFPAVKTSAVATADDRWRLSFDGDLLTLRSVEYLGYVQADGAPPHYTVRLNQTLSDFTRWDLVILPAP